LELFYIKNMATLYTQAEKNVRKTWVLITSFLIFVIFLGWIFSRVFNNSLILYFAVFLTFLQSFVSYWYSDKIVLAMTGAKPVEKKDNPELYRIVENLCIAAGLPVPKIYIIDDDQPNAFATGRDKNHAVIAVTRGLLEKLEKVELEGVISHELAHIGNKDMLLQTITVTLVGFVTILSDWFFRASFWGIGRKNDEKNNANSIFAILAIVTAILAPLAAQLIHLAISRKREFLADATGALITRYPEGLARALEKIASYPNSMKTASTATAHLFIVNPLRGKEKQSWLTKLFSTHPPIEERIKALREMSI
jgi:heat shock protein HtpX